MAYLCAQLLPWVRGRKVSVSVTERERGGGGAGEGGLGWRSLDRENILRATSAG